MLKHLPEEIIEAINYEVGRGDLDFADNYRAYRHKDDKFLEEYNTSYDYGCCGYLDMDYVDAEGDTWTIGCNYGH